MESLPLPPSMENIRILIFPTKIMLPYISVPLKGTPWGGTSSWVLLDIFFLLEKTSHSKSKCPNHSLYLLRSVRHLSYDWQEWQEQLVSATKSKAQSSYYYKFLWGHGYYSHFTDVKTKSQSHKSGNSAAKIYSISYQATKSLLSFPAT
jgi:hypothetical protein